MDNLAKYPVAVLALSFFVMSLSARIGLLFRSRKPSLAEDARQDLDLIVAGALTLLGLIIGFSFSMAISRYDQRKTYEEAGTRRPAAGIIRSMVLPFVLSISFFAIADIDSPRRGLIRVRPQNLISLVHSLQ